MGSTALPDRVRTQGQTIRLHVRAEDVPELRGQCQANLVDDSARSQRADRRAGDKGLECVLNCSSIQMVADKDMTFQKAPGWMAIHPVSIDLQTAAKEYKALHAAVQRIEPIPHPIMPSSPALSASIRFM